MIEHAKYVVWAARVTKNANEGIGDRPPMTRAGLDFHLFRWAVAQGYLNDPGQLQMPRSAYLADVLERWPEEIAEEVERYRAGLAKERERLF